MITGFPCIRALKEAQALVAKGHVITLLCSRLPNHLFWNKVCESVHVYETYGEYTAKLEKLAEGADIIHGHNEPNWHIATAIVLLNKSKPVIYDCHDFTSMRIELGAYDRDPEKKPFEQYERDMEEVCFKQADAVVHVSQELSRQALIRYKQKKSIVLYSFPSASAVQFKPKKKKSGIHIAYEGGLSESGQGLHDYRYYIEYFKEIASSGVIVDVYPSEVVSEKTRESYRLIDGGERVRVASTFVYDQLLAVMSGAHWGFTGFYRHSDEKDSKATYLDNAMPNKLFEYLYAGLTPVVINCKEAGNFVTAHNVGYHAKDMKECIDILHNAPQLVQNLDVNMINMDEQISLLENVYYDVLGITMA